MSRDVEQLELPFTAGVRFRDYIPVHFGKLTVSYKVKHTSNFDAAILLLGKYYKN